MAVITFSSPAYRDKTVYAVVDGQTGSVLKIARSSQIPLTFKCEDGRCGSCVVRVSGIDHKRSTQMGGPLTAKEATILCGLGKLSREQVDTLALEELPTEWRLACQMIPLDEDILVEY